MIHPAIDYELIKTRIADLQRQAEQDGAVRGRSAGPPAAGAVQRLRMTPPPADGSDALTPATKGPQP